MRAFIPHLILFFAGLMLVPCLIIFRYTIHWEADSSIRLIPKPNQMLAVLSDDSSLFGASASNEISKKACARNRWVIKKALQESGDEVLNFFSLISRGFLKEIPNCPQGGTYQLTDPKSRNIICNFHGETDS